MYEKPAKLPPAADANTLYIVDLSGYVFRAYHAIAPLSNSKGESTHAVMGTVNMLQKVVNDRKPQLFAVALDSRTPTFRKALDERYKANRPAPPDDLITQLNRCQELVSAYGVAVFQEDGLEADDLIATATKRAVSDGMAVVIVSADKDLMQLIHDDDTQVVLWDSMRDRVYGPAEVFGKFGVPPSQLRDLLALTGDTSDNVPGVPSVGPKTAADLLALFGTLDGVYTRLAEVKRPKLRDALRDNESDARLSQQLVTLKTDAVIAWGRDHLTYTSPDHERLHALYTELEFNRLRDQLQQKMGGARGTTAVQVVADTAPRKKRLIVTEAELAEFCVAASKQKSLALFPVCVGSDPMTASLVGLSLAATEGEGFYLPLGHRFLGVPAQLTIACVRDALGPLLADASIEKYFAKGRFVEHVLRRNGMSVAGEIFDPLLAHYILDSEGSHELGAIVAKEFGVELPPLEAPAVGKKKDRRVLDELDFETILSLAGSYADYTLSLGLRTAERIQNDGLGPLLRDLELPLARVLVKLEAAGVGVDLGVLDEVGVRIAHELVELEARAKAIVGHPFSMRSRDDLETILFDELKLPVIKKTPKGGRSTDAIVLDELSDRHELPQVILEHRELDKIKGTYVDALPRYVNANTGRIHTKFEQTVAATGRLSSIDPNLQNIPIRTAVGREIRRAFVPRAGHRFVSADYSQIELRLLAHLSGDTRLCEAFIAREDVHAHTASVVFDVPLAEVDKDMRRKAKAVNFGVIYGMGESALAKQLGIPRGEAAAFIAAYFRRYEGVRTFLEKVILDAKKGEAVHTLLGRRRFLPNLHSGNRGLRYEAERIAKNTPIQGSAADLMKLAMLALDKSPASPNAVMLLSVHDEVVFEVPESEVAVAMASAKQTMESVYALRVPLEVDVADGATWAEAHG